MIDLSKLPAPADKNIAVRVKPAAERAIRQGHPWVFEDSITKQSHLGNAGDLVVVYDREKNRFLAVGLYDPFSPIRIKVLQNKRPERINLAWFIKRLEAAKARREALKAQGNTGYRLVYGESDGLPALVIDRYDDTLVMKLYTVAWLPYLKTLIAAMQKTLAFENLVLRLSRALHSGRHDVLRLYGLADGQVLLGSDDLRHLQFQENGLWFQADVQRGHKTGFFFDQRDNRQLARELADGRRILDVFAYSGGFSVYGLAGGAKSVLALDSSEPALEALKSNVALNGMDGERVNVMAAEAFSGLQELLDARRKFNMVIIDPPALANSRANVQKAVFAYRRLVEMGLALLSAEGLLLMCSCSSRISLERFQKLVARSAEVAGYDLEISETTSHALDHPIGFPEAEYLKAIFALLKS